VRRTLNPLSGILVLRGQISWTGWLNRFIPKLFLRLLFFFRRTAALFRQIRTFPQLFRLLRFRFCSDLKIYFTESVRDSRRTCNNTMLAPRVLCVLAVLAGAAAVPSLNLPTEAPPHGTPIAPDGKMHSEFVAWKAKVLCPPQTCLIWFQAR